MHTSEKIDLQLEILEKQLAMTKDKLPDGKWNPRWFALKGKIAKIKQDRIKHKQFEFLAR